MKKWSIWIRKWPPSPPLKLSGDIESNPGPSIVPTTSSISHPQTGLHIIHINIRSLLPHFDEFKIAVSDLDPDIVALSETWLDSSVDDIDISLDGYNVVRRDRN